MFRCLLLLVRITNKRKLEGLIFICSKIIFQFFYTQDEDDGHQLLSFLFYYADGRSVLLSFENESQRLKKKIRKSEGQHVYMSGERERRW